MYDVRAAKLVAMLVCIDARVLEASLDGAGYLVLSLTESVKIELIPMANGPVEAWRIFQRGGEHYVYPAELD